MAHIFLAQLKATLDNCIDELEQIHFLFSKNPETYFSRKRKLIFKEYIQFMLLMQGKSVSNEILDFFQSFPVPPQILHLHSSVISFCRKESLIPVSVLSAYILKMATIFVLRQISQKSNFPLKR